MYGGNKKKSFSSIKNSQEKKAKSLIKMNVGTGFGGHFRAVQGFKYLGKR